MGHKPRRKPLPLAEAMAARYSVRAFHSQPLRQEALDTLFSVAQRAPSWCNIQPWHVVVTMPPKTQAVREALLAAARAGHIKPDVSFPNHYPEPYLDRRRQCGKALYQTMGIERDDHQGRASAWLRNYEIFGAPHLAVVSRPRVIGEYATLDVGVWLGVLMAAASTQGVGMCAMASVAACPGVLRAQLDIPSSNDILFGIAIGRADESAAVNQCRTTRENFSSCVTFAR